MLSDVNGLIIYWINLDTSVDRRKHMEKVLQDPVFDKIPIKRRKAFDTKKRNIETQFEIVTPSPHMKSLHYACLFSHLDTIRAFSKSKYKYALIFEDDLSLDYKPYWKKTLREVIDNAPPDWGILQLGYGINHGNDLPKKEYTPMSLGNYHTAVAYLVSKPAAIQFVKDYYHDGKYTLYNSICQEADNFTFNVIKTYTYKYPFFTNDMSFSSTTGNQTRFAKLSKETITSKLFHRKNHSLNKTMKKNTKWRATRCINGVRKNGFIDMS